MGDNKVVVELALENGQYTIGVKNAGSLMREFKRTLDQTAASVKKVEQNQDSLGRKFRDIVLTMGQLRFVAMDINDILLRLPMAVLKTAGELERIQQLMTGLSKEADNFKRKAEGMANFNFVVDVAKNSPFQITALADSFVKLKTAGINPANGSMQALIDSVARFGGTGETLKRASVAIQQMAGKGVISMEELRQQLGEAVPSAMQDMADAMGLSMSELADKVSKGIVAAGPALEKMLLVMKVRNRGAAKDMMDTWVGMTAQLETEWNLAAKAIADAGFADEAKKGVQQLIEILRSDGFQRFALEAGATLGEAVRMLIDGVQWFIKWREEIGYLVQGWIAYKVVMSGIVPLAERLNGVYKTALPGLLDQAKTLANNAALKREDMIAEAARLQYNAQANADRLAQKLAADQRELQLHRVKNNAILFEDRQLRAQLEALEKRAFTPGLNDGGARDAARKRLQELADANRMMTQRQAELTLEVDKGEKAHRRASEAARNKAREVSNLANMSNLARLGANAAAVATAAWGVALNALGGPVGVAIMAIMGLVWWYENAKNKAEELAAADKRIKMGMSDEKDIKQQEERLKAATAARDAAWNQYKNGTTMQGRQKSDEERALELANFKKAQEEETQARLSLEKARSNVLDNAARDTMRVEQVNMDRQLDQIKLHGQGKVNALMKAFEDEKGKYKEGSKELKALRDKLTADQLKADRESLEAQAKALDNQAQILTGKAEGMRSGAERTAAIRASEEFRKRAQQLRDEAAGALKTIQGPNVYTAGDKGDKWANKDSPLKRYLENLQEDNARLAAELAGLDENTGKADVVFGAIAQVWKKWENGDFDKTDKDGNTTRPTVAQMAPVLTEVVNAENYKARIKSMQDAAKNAEEVARFVDQLKPDFERAAEILADPLQVDKRGPTQARISKFLEKTSPEKLLDYANKNKTTVDQLVKELTRQAATIDAATLFDKEAEDTKQINDSMVADTREASIARMTADNERHRQVMENAITEARAANVSASEIARMEGIMAESMAARGRKLSLAMRSPMEVMAEQWANTTKNMEEASGRWAESTLNFFNTLVTTGKADFKGLVTSILADLARIQLQKAMAPALSGAASFVSSLFAFADGGIMTELGSAPLRKYAAGGVANSPQLALFGEGSKPEAYVPLPDGRTIPVTLKGAGQGGSDVQINITVNQNGSESSSATGKNADAFKKMGERVKAVVREELASQARPGGMLYR